MSSAVLERTAPEDVDAATAPPHVPSMGLAARVGWTVVALFVAFSGSKVWGGSLAVPGANEVALTLICGGLAAVALSWVRRRGLTSRLQVLLLLGMAAGVAYQSVLAWLYNPGYGTDAAAFDQYAGWLLLHGSNPYVHSMSPALAMFHVPSIFHTYRLDGTAVTSLSYPSGSFLAYLPLLALGVQAQAANIMDLVFWVAGMFLLWRMLPRDTRWAAGLLGGAGIYVSWVIGGLTDALFVPFVLLAVYRWDAFVTERRWTRWVGPVALGLAISIKQTPWFLIPYLLLGLFFEARRSGVNPWRAVGGYALAVAGVFTALNAPFFLASPGAWAKGSLVPFLDPTIPDGQGLVNLTTFERIGGGNLQWYTALGAVFTLLALALFVLRYTRFKRAWVPLIAVGFLFPTRSFGSYLFIMIPAALVAATTVAPAQSEPFPRLSRHARWLLPGGALVVLALVGLALHSRAPLRINIVGTQSTGQMQTLDEVTVHVTNRTDRTIVPHFTVNANDHATTFWYTMGTTGPYAPTVGPHASVTLTLHAPNTESMPSVTAPFMVEAFTMKPATASISGQYLVSGMGTQIVPDAVDKPVPVGRPVKLTVQVENQYGSPIRQAGLPITLGQTVYGQDAFFPGESSINGAPEGRTPVTVRTDANGQAVFTVVGLQDQGLPVYYQAWIALHGGVPHAYSNQVSVQYEPARR